MVRAKLRNVLAIKKRLASGEVRTYYYHRYSKVRLPDDPNSVEFMEALVLAGRSGGAPKAGSLHAVIQEYLKSDEFNRLKPNSRYLYRLSLDHLRKGEISKNVQIGSITGHASAQMVEHYAKAANQKKLAQNAVAKLDEFRTKL